jgi:hypothetical protein
MEFRWLAQEERQAQSVESGSLPEVLALAQKLQADAEGRLSEEQVTEMGRELGIQPEYVREALRLRRSGPPVPEVVETAAHPERGGRSPVGAVAHFFMLVFAAGLFPVAAQAIYWAFGDPIAVLLASFLLAAMAGWCARYPRLAAIAGAFAVPLVLLLASLYAGPGQIRVGEATFLSLLSLCPLCTVMGRGGAKLRRWMEALAARERETAPGH